MISRRIIYYAIKREREREAHPDRSLNADDLSVSLFIKFAAIFLAIAFIGVGLFVACQYSSVSKAEDVISINPETGYPYADHIINGNFEYGAFDIGDGCVYVSLIDKTFAFPNASDTSRKSFTDHFIDGQKFGWVSTETTYTNWGYPIRKGDVQVNYCSASTNYYADLCTTTPKTAIYQDILTTPGTKYKWKLKHQSAWYGYPDSMQVLIGSTSSQTAQDATRTTSNGGSDQIGSVGKTITTVNVDAARAANANWETYEGEYTIPAGQTITRFTFAATKLGYYPDGNGNTGDFVDDIEFAVLCPITYVEYLSDGSDTKEQVIRTVDIPAYSTAEGITNAETRHSDEGYSFRGYKDENGNDVDLTNITEPMTIYLAYEKDPLPIEVESNADGFGSAVVSWPDYNIRNKNFKVYQSSDGKNTWNSVGIDYRDVEEVRCLQIYPTDATKNQLKQWIEDSGYGQHIIQTEAVSIDEFNANPNVCLQDENGNYKYDVIMFGSLDGNGQKDLNKNSASVTREYLKTGRGVIFGHDTMCRWKEFEWSHFNSLATYAGISIPQEPAVYNSGYCSTQVRITQQGLLTNYPNYIGPQGTILNIPKSHPSQGTFGKIWADFVGDLTLSPGVTNFYISTYNNCAFIQTGHTSGSSTSDEQKILANLVFYMNQLLFDKAILRDASAQDTTAPNLSVPQMDISSKTLSVTPQDVGNTYFYYVESYLKDDTTKSGLIQTSDIKDVEVITETRSLRYLFDMSSETKIANSTAGTTVVDAADGEKATIDWAGQYGKYLHIAAVDGAGNISQTKTIRIPMIRTITIMDSITNKTITTIEAVEGDTFNISSDELDIPEHSGFVFTKLSQTSGVVSGDMTIMAQYDYADLYVPKTGSNRALVGIAIMLLFTGSSTTIVAASIIKRRKKS